MSDNFQQHYNKLAQIAQQLPQQTELDIDRMLQLLADATQSYQICKQRIDDAKRALEQILQ